MEHGYTTITTYTDVDGVEREIAVDVDAGGRFRILDVAGGEALIVALLRSEDDDAERALRCAADYGAQIAAYLAGARDAMPCPHPLGRKRRRVVLGARPDSTPSTPAATWPAS